MEAAAEPSPPSPPPGSQVKPFSKADLAGVTAGMVLRMVENININGLVSFPRLVS